MGKLEDLENRVEELEESQENLSNDVRFLAEMMDQHDDRISAMSSQVEWMFEVSDLQFWTLVRARLEGDFEERLDESEDDRMDRLHETIRSYQDEYLAVRGIASFFSHYGEKEED